MLGLWGQTHIGSSPKSPLLIPVTWCLETEPGILVKEIY